MVDMYPHRRPAAQRLGSFGPLGQWFLDPRRWKSLAMTTKGFTKQHSSTGALRRQQGRTNQQRPQPR